MKLRASVRGKKPLNTSTEILAELFKDPKHIQTRGSKANISNEQKPQPTFTSTKRTRVLKPPKKNLTTQQAVPKSKKNKVTKPSPVKIVTKSPVKTVTTRSKANKKKALTPKKSSRMFQEKLDEEKALDEEVNDTKKKQTLCNQITNYFKKDPIPKEERMKKGIVLKNTRKSVCFANASILLQKSPSKVEEDPYEFIPDSPKHKKQNRRVYRKTPAVVKSKIKRNSNKDPPPILTLNEDPVIEKPLAKPTDPNKSPEKQTSKEKLPKIGSLSDKPVINEPVKNKPVPATTFINMELSSINDTNHENLTNEQHKTLDVTEDCQISEITPLKNDRNPEENYVFKTPGLPLKSTENNVNFFSKVAAISTPKELPKKPEEFPKKPKELPKKPEELSKKPKELPKKPEELPKKPKELPKKPEELSKKPEELPKKPEELLKKPEELPKKPKELPKKPEEQNAVARKIMESTPKVSNRIPQQKSPVKQIPKGKDSENISPESLNIRNVDISPIDTISASPTPIHPEDVDIYDEIDDENDCIMSGSFIDCEKSVYDDENLKRASTPENSMVDHSLVRSESSVVGNQLDPYSLYGCPIELSPVKAHESEDEENGENLNIKVKLIKKGGMTKIKSSSNENQGNFSPRKRMRSYSAHPRKKKKVEPNEEAYEKWVSSFRAEIEEVEKTELIFD